MTVIQLGRSGCRRQYGQGEAREDEGSDPDHGLFSVRDTIADVRTSKMLHTDAREVVAS